VKLNSHKWMSTEWIDRLEIRLDHPPPILGSRRPYQHSQFAKKIAGNPQ